MRASSIVFALLLVLSSLVFIQVASATDNETDTTLTLSAGTFTSTVLTGDAVILDNVEDGFSTNPFATDWQQIDTSDDVVTWDSTNLWVDLGRPGPIGVGGNAAIRTVSTSSWTQTDSFTMTFDIRFIDLDAVSGTTAPQIGMVSTAGTLPNRNNEVGADFLYSYTSNCAQVRAYIIGSSTQTGSYTTCASLAEDTTYEARFYYDNDVLSVTVGSVTSSVTRNSGNTFTLNRPEFQNPAPDLLRMRLDNVRLSTAASGSWRSAIQTLPEDNALRSVALTYSAVDSTELFSQVTVRDSGGTVLVTYDTDITSGTSIELGDTAGATRFESGNLLNVPSSYTVQVDFAGNGAQTPRLTGVTVTTAPIHPVGSDPDPPTLLEAVFDFFFGGTGYGLGGGFPINGLRRVCNVGPTDWLSAQPGGGARTVTVTDSRREAALAIFYIIAWGDGKGSSGVSTPLNHTYQKADVYRISVRISYQDGSIQRFDALVDVRGNNCSLQMFAEEFFPILLMLGGLAFIGAFTVFVMKRPGRIIRLGARVRRLLYRYLLIIALIVIGLVVAIAIYAQGAGIPI